MSDILAFASIEEVGRLYRARELSPVELADALLDRIARLDPLLGCYVTVAEGTLRAQAKEAERALAHGETGRLGPPHGIPLSLEDNIATAGIRTTAGLFEFAFGEAHDDYGHVRNPWSLERSKAGSSSGSVASVAAGLCFGSVGTDDGGSIRVPAALTGVVGLKPTYGRIPTAGTIPTTSTGRPALAVPCGFSRAGLPIGFQVVGAPLGEAVVLRIGRAYERATDWHDRRPPRPGAVAA